MGVSSDFPILFHYWKQWQRLQQLILPKIKGLRVPGSRIPVGCDFGAVRRQTALLDICTLWDYLGQFSNYYICYFSCLPTTPRYVLVFCPDFPSIKIPTIKYSLKRARIEVKSLIYCCIVCKTDGTGRSAGQTWSCSIRIQSRTYLTCWWWMCPLGYPNEINILPAFIRRLPQYYRKCIIVRHWTLAHIPRCGITIAELRNGTTL